MARTVRAVMYTHRVDHGSDRRAFIPSGVGVRQIAVIESVHDGGPDSLAVLEIICEEGLEVPSIDFRLSRRRGVFSSLGSNSHVSSDLPFGARDPAGPVPSVLCAVNLTRSESGVKTRIALCSRSVRGECRTIAPSGGLPLRRTPLPWVPAGRGNGWIFSTGDRSRSGRDRLRAGQTHREGGPHAALALA